MPFNLNLKDVALRALTYSPLTYWSDIISYPLPPPEDVYMIDDSGINLIDDGGNYFIE